MSLGICEFIFLLTVVSIASGIGNSECNSREQFTGCVLNEEY